MGNKYSMDRAQTDMKKISAILRSPISFYKRIRSPDGFLVGILYQVLDAFKVTEMEFDQRLNRYSKETIRLFPTSRSGKPVSASSTRSNLCKQLTSREITLNIFNKGMVLIGVKNIEYTLKVTRHTLGGKEEVETIQGIYHTDMSYDTLGSAQEEKTYEDEIDSAFNDLQRDVAAIIQRDGDGQAKDDIMTALRNSLDNCRRSVEDATASKLEGSKDDE